MTHIKTFKKLYFLKYSFVFYYIKKLNVKTIIEVKFRSVSAEKKVMNTGPSGKKNPLFQWILSPGFKFKKIKTFFNKQIMMIWLSCYARD